MAGYCRVSTDKEDQANSFASQQAYFREYISRHPDWELYDIYADEGITGTSTHNRLQFNQMIEDAHMGKFQLIITKEVSRFSRNILDSIRYTRELKAIGVFVLFLLDGIHTQRSDAELHLSIMASLAQEESRKTSERVTWGQTRQMEKGIVFGRSLLGYEVKNGKLTIEPNGAKIVQLIFHKYVLEQMGTTQIAKYLTQMGYHTQSGSGQWHPNSIIKILKNEKYVGDLVQKKSYTPDYLTHKKKANTGQVPRISIKDHHEPIISIEIWNLAQKRLQRNRKSLNTQNHSCRHTFSGKIFCAECGSTFVCRYKYQKNGKKIRRWSCGSAARQGRAGCDIGKLLLDDDAIQMFQTAIQNLKLDREMIANNVTSRILSAIRSRNTDSDAEQRRIHNEIQSLQKKKERMLDSFFAGTITKDDMLSMKLYYEEQLKSLEVHLCEIKAEQGDPEIFLAVKQLLNGESENGVFCKYLLESITVYKDRHMELRLKNHPQVFNFLG